MKVLVTSYWRWLMTSREAMPSFDHVGPELQRLDRLRRIELVDRAAGLVQERQELEHALLGLHAR